MRFKNTRGVLDHVKHFHQAVSARSMEICGKSDEERIRVLLNYIADREQDLAQAVSTLTEDTDDSILDTWFQYTTDDAALNSLLTDSIKPNMSPGDIMSATMAISDHLLDMFRGMLDAAPTDALRQVFQNLLDHEQVEREKLARNLEMFQDL